MRQSLLKTSRSTWPLRVSRQTWCHCASIFPVDTHGTYRIRGCRPTDVAQVASICAKVFVYEKFEQKMTDADNASLQGLIDSYTDRVRDEVSKKLQTALQRKLQAAASTRDYNAYRLKQIDKNGGVMLEETAEYQRQLARWETQRMVACFVAEELATGELVGCANLALMQPEAILPPPLPSSAPMRAYVSNMAVLPSHRRQGLASALLTSCEKLSTRWHQDSIWLHVNCLNTGAQQLYASMGYSRAPGAGGYMGLLQELLMCKTL